MATEPVGRPTATVERPPRRQAWWALVLLAFINLLNYLDRNVIFALFEPIKAELSLTDAQLGWLGSAYILVFSLAALPLGVLSDVKSRKSVIAGGVMVWSAFTFLGGLVRNFGQLFFCRSAVGIGEAAFGPASTSMTADYFPGKDRAIAMGILAAGIPVGGVLGLLLGGALEQVYGWRVAFMAVGLPGFICAMLVGRLVDPTRADPPLTLRGSMRDLEIGLRSFGRMFRESLLFTAIGLGAAWLLTVNYGADSKVDVAVLAGSIVLGFALNVWRWVRLVRRGQRAETPWTREFEGALDDLIKAGNVVLATPTLVYLFVAGAMIAFGMNGIVGWGPTFMTRTFGLTAGQSAALLGKWGLVTGVAGALTGGLVADWLGRYTDRSRVITVAVGLLIGGPLTIWLLTIRELDLFIPIFAVAFFFLSWYNGPLMAVVFDVVPSRIGATVSGAYLLFIHLAGDAIAFPLVGSLSDRIGLGQAVMVLPIVAVIGGVVSLGALRTVSRDMHRIRMTTTGSHRVADAPE
ncbi:MAG TPA: MFS transporter [Gemmatimonadales bacterium]|nr:MFS transporter [Gemmatimonadales bacterium]